MSTIEEVKDVRAPFEYTTIAGDHPAELVEAINKATKDGWRLHAFVSRPYLTISKRTGQPVDSVMFYGILERPIPRN